MVTKSILRIAFISSILGISACKTLDLKIRVTPLPGNPMSYAFEVDGEGADEVIHWIWDFGDETEPASERSVEHTYKSQGHYVVYMSGAYGKYVAGDSVHINICTQNFKVGIETVGCSDIKLTLPDGVPVPSDVKWGDSIDYNYGQLYHPYARTGQKNLTVVWEMGPPCGQVKWDTTIAIGVPAKAGFDLGRVGPLLDVKNLSGGSVGGFQWDYGDGNTSNAVQDRHRYASPGPYNVTLVVLPAGCTPGDTHSTYITIPYSEEHYQTEFKDRCECEATGTIGAPRYYWNGYTIDADSLGLYRTVIREDLDIVNGTPRLQWDEYSTPYQRQVAIITSQRPIDADGNFVGPSSGDWMWTIAMDEGESGKVDFSQGKTIDRIENGTPIYKEGPPEALKPGVYFWMIYAFNENASRIGACSRIHLFKVP